MSYFTEEELYIASIVMEILNRDVKEELHFGRSKHYWVGRVVHSLFPKSKEKHDPKVMLDEWIYCGVSSISDELHDCNLCGHKETLYTFEICNTVTGKTHECGSKCMTRFMQVANKFTQANYDIEHELKKMHGAIRKAEERKRRELIISAINESRLSDEFKQSITKLHSDGKGTVTPAQAIVLIDCITKDASDSLKLRIGKKQLSDAMVNYDKLEHLMTSEQCNRSRPK